MKKLKQILLFIVFLSGINAYSQSIEEYKMIDSDTIFYIDNTYQVIDYSYFKIKSFLKFDENKKIVLHPAVSTNEITNYDTITSNFKIIEIKTHPLTYKKIGKKIIKFNSYFYLLEEISTNKYFYLILFDYKDEKNPIIELGKTYNLTLKSVFHEDLSDYQCELSSDFIINNYLVLNLNLTNMVLNTLIKYNFLMD